MKQINLWLGTRYWYQLRYIYTNKRGDKKFFDFVQEVGLTERRKMLNRRLIKKLGQPLHKDPKLNNIFKCLPSYHRNGRLSVEIIAYIGWFKK